MRRLMLGLCLACSIAATSGGCCGPCSRWLGWNQCGGGCSQCGGGGCRQGGCGQGDCGGGGGCSECGECAACSPFGNRFGRPGGCGEWYWGDWCSGNPHCQTCDNCANWVGPDAPGGNGTPPSVYGTAHPYGNRIAANQTMPPKEYAPQIVRHMNQKQYAPTRAQMAQMRREQAQMQMAQNGQPRGQMQQMQQSEVQMAQYAPSRSQPQQRVVSAEFAGYPQQPVVQRGQVNRFGGPPQRTQRPSAGSSRQQFARQQSPQMAPPRGQVARNGNGNQREYEGAIEYLGTTDTVVTPAQAPQTARRGQLTPADPSDADGPIQAEPTIRQAQARRPVQR